MYRDRLAFAMSKSSPYFDAFSFHIGSLKESGKVKRYADIYEGTQRICPDSSGNPLSMKQCFTTIITLLIGFAVSVMWLVIEVCLPRKWTDSFNRGIDRIYTQLK